MKKYIYPLAITATLLATAACSDDEVNAVDQPIPDSQKEMISFSLSDGAASTRAGFTSPTRIIARIQSDEKGSSNTKYTKTALKAAVDGTNDANSFSLVSYYDNNTRYWDDAFGRKAKLSVYAVAIPNSEETSKLTLEKVKGNTTWDAESTPDNTIVWNVTTSSLSSTIIDSEDLVYSNNIKAGGKDGVYRWDYTANPQNYPNNTGTVNAHKDGQMLFYQQAMTDENAATELPSSAPGHFDKGHLVFNHALTRLTVKLKKDAGFVETSAFAFKTGTQITLYSMPVSGTFDIAAGTWLNTTESPITTGNIAGMSKTSTETTAAGTYMAQMLPGYTFAKDDNTNVLDFTIDNNTYYITKGMIFKALNDKAGTGEGKNGLDASATSYTMEQGKNYSIEINVQKAAITNVTATLVKWNDIAGSMDIDNAHITITTQLFKDAADADPDKYEENHSLESHYLWRHEQLADLTTAESGDTYKDYSGTYKDPTTATLMSGSTNKWTATDWYFNDNLTAYHIRSINALAHGTDGNNVSKTSATDDPESYFTMVNGPQTSADYHWGAPMKSGSTPTYNTTNGFSTSLYQGIRSTKSDINITEFHMMSNIDVILTTPAAPTTTNNSVVLYDETNKKGCTVEFVDVLTKATVDMGTGLVTASTRATEAVSLTKPDETSESTYYPTSKQKVETNAFTYAFVPQSLSNGTGTDAKNVSVKITTPDGNTYFVPSLKDVFVNGSTEKIAEWLPNHRYVYTFNLTKTGIANITATLVKWETVTAGSTDINLEK